MAVLSPDIIRHGQEFSRAIKDFLPGSGTNLRGHETAQRSPMQESLRSHLPSIVFAGLVTIVISHENEVLNFVDALRNQLPFYK